jgi:hypothetical protein
MVVLPMMEFSSDLKAAAMPEVNSGALRCAEPAADGGMMYAARVLASFGAAAVTREMYFYTVLLDQMEEVRWRVTKYAGLL